VVKAGSDTLIDGSSIDKFVFQARLSKITTEYVELAGAPHGFDVFRITVSVRISLPMYFRACTAPRNR